MKFKNLKAGRSVIASLFVMITMALSSCVEGMDPDTIYRVSDGYMIDEYIQNSADLNICEELINISTFAGMLHGYGSYTFFAPTDAAFQKYLASIGKTDITQLTQQEADQIIKYHVIRDSIKTTDLIDGKVKSPTIS